MKKILVIALAALMLAVMAVPAFAAESEEVVCGGWWGAWSQAYEITDEALVLDIHHTSQGTDNWDGIVAVFSNVYTDGTSAPNEAGAADGYAEYVVFRADSYGWGNAYVAGSCTATTVDANEDGDVWDDFRGIMADCDIVATFEKTETGLKLTYDVTGANGASFVYTATADCDTSAGLYVFFTGEECTYTIAPHVEAPVETPDQGTTDAPQTGVATIALAVVAIASGAYIVSKKH